MLALMWMFFGVISCFRGSTWCFSDETEVTAMVAIIPIHSAESV